MAEKDDLFTVTGELRDAVRVPLAGMAVRAIELDRASEGHVLGEAVSDAAGQFRITFRRADYVRSMAEALGKTGPWLMLRVLAADGGVLLAPRARPFAGRGEHYLLTLPPPPVPTGPAARALAFWASRLAAPPASLAELRRAADLLPADEPDRDMQRLMALAELSRFFAPDVAAAFEEAGAAGVAALTGWPAHRVAGALALGGIGPAAVDRTRERLAALRNAATPPENGLMLEVGSDALPAADLDALRRAGIATLEEWRERRVDPDLGLGGAGTALLDAHLRLAACGASAATARKLIRAGIGTARALAAADPVALAAEAELDPAVLAPVVVAATDRLAALPARLAASILHFEAAPPAWLARMRPMAGDLAAGWAVLARDADAPPDADLAPELDAFRRGRALTAVPAPAERAAARAALIRRLDAIVPADDPDEASEAERAVAVIRAVLTADAALARADAAALADAAEALDRAAALAFPEGSPARHAVAADGPDTAAVLRAAWGYAGAAPDGALELPALPEDAAPDAAAVSALLDACLALAFHLRVAELPLRRAGLAAAVGDRANALAALDRLDRAIASHPWAAPPPAALCPVVSADIRLARLHRGAVLQRLAAAGDRDAAAMLEGATAAVALPAPDDADLDALVAGGAAALPALRARWAEAAFHTPPQPRDRSLFDEAELYLEGPVPPAAPHPAAVQRVLGAWLAGAAFRPSAAAAAQALAAALATRKQGPSLHDALERHGLARRLLRSAEAALDQPQRRWEAAAAAAAVAAAPPLRIGYDAWLDDARCWRARSEARLAGASRELADAAATARLAAAAEAAATAAGVAPPSLPDRPEPLFAGRMHRAAGRSLTLSISLAALAPVALQLFREGAGSLRFGIDPVLLRRARPDLEHARLDALRFRLVGIDVPPSAIAAQLVLGGDPGGGAPARAFLAAKPHPAGGVMLAVPRAEMPAFRRATLDLDCCLDLPKAANGIDFARLADVVLELRLAEAEGSFPGPNGPVPAEGERIVSLARHFPAVWAELIAAARAASPPPLSLAFTLRPGDFPPHMQGLRLTDVTVQVLGPAAAMVDELALRLTGRMANGLVRQAGGPAALDAGIAGTRRPDLIGEQPWQVLRGLAPDGEWAIELPERPDLRGALATGGIADIVLTLAYAGTRPAWPD